MLEGMFPRCPSKTLSPMLSRLSSRAFVPSCTLSLFRPIVPVKSALLPNTPLQTRSLSSTTSAMAEWKLKDLTSINLENCDKQEVEVEGIEGGKVLLVKVQDKVHALNANCTHYGAPLKNGVVTPEGRLTCPWHGGTLVLSRSSQSVLT